jgi:uncharacterized integral membrane protein
MSAPDHMPSTTSHASRTDAAVAQPEPLETRGGHRRRMARRFRLNLLALISVALVLCIVALAVANTGRVRLHWLLGSGNASLVWIVLLSVVLGWLLGLVTRAVLRWRTRAPRS